MQKLIVIIVGYNEEKNLPKCFDSLEKVSNILDIRKIYIDQSSHDESVSLAKKYWCETYIHPNLWYADPDKKWGVENLCSPNDWILILDADEEITLVLAQEIVQHTSTKTTVCRILVRSIIFWWFGGEAYQPRLFQKHAVNMTEEIHNYIHIASENVVNLKNPIINDDLKYKWKEIQVFMEKLNRYSDKEIENLYELSQFKIIIFMIWKPIQRFFGFGFVHRQFFRGIRWYILCAMMAHYQRSIYAKLYEKKYIK